MNNFTSHAKEQNALFLAWHMQIFAQSDL